MVDKIRYVLLFLFLIPVVLFVAHQIARTIFRAWFKTKQEMLPTESEEENHKGKR